MLTRRRFEMELEELRPDIATLRRATDELRLSVKFKRVLQVRKLHAKREHIA